MLAKSIKIVLKKIKTKNVNMLVNDMKLFLKKKKTKQVSIFKYKNLSENEKQKLFGYIKNCYIALKK